MQQEPKEKRNRLRNWLGRVTLGYVALLALGLVYLDWRGGSDWVSSLPIFFPTQCWLAPLIILLTAALMLNRRLCWLLLVTVFLVFAGYMNFHCAFGRSGQKADITVLNNNVDLRDIEGMLEFARSRDPDIIVLEEGGGLAAKMRRRFPGRYVANYGEFLLVSRFPIVSVTPVPGVTRGSEYLAVRFELLREGRSLVIYNVHMPTPRFFFRALRDDALLADSPQPILGIGPGQSWDAYAGYWRRRIELARLLNDAVSHEQCPVVLAGDFNMPDHGMLYRDFASRYVDAFARTGWGYGLTFPGNYDSIMTLYRPWLRIDYQFAGRGVIPLSCEVEPFKRAKHLAVFGRYQLSQRQVN